VIVTTSDPAIEPAKWEAIRDVGFRFGKPRYSIWDATSFRLLAR
jgi:hypothetical protein